MHVAVGLTWDVPQDPGSLVVRNMKMVRTVIDGGGDEDAPSDEDDSNDDEGEEDKRGKRDGDDSMVTVVIAM